MNHFQTELESLHQNNLWRSLREIESAQGPLVQHAGKTYLNFASNDYLGLANNPQVIKATQLALTKWGTGSGSSRLVAGSLSIHHELEKSIAEFKHAEAALIFSSGYQANIGVIQALIGKDDCVIVDRYAHASIVDGARLSGAKIQVCAHLDTLALSKILAKNKAKKCLVITDSYFSMDGDLVPLEEYIKICKQNGTLLMVDDAHGVGVYGESGEGVVSRELMQQCDIVTGTFSKSLGSQGGFVVAKEDVIDYLRNKARSFIYSTGPNPASSAATLESITILKSNPALRETLWSNIDYVRQELIHIGCDLMNSQGPIIPILIGDTHKAMLISQKLLESGILAPAIRPPTVSKNTDRIRITITAKHTKADIDKFLTTLRSILEENK
ncbi:MAG: 8-amino-7-oxononanoate synthase [Candidatus Omnitrophota bacterium]